VRGARTLCQDLEIEPDASLTLDDNGVAAPISLCQGDCCVALLGTGPFLFSPLREGAPNESKDIARYGDEERSPLGVKDPWEDGITSCNRITTRPENHTQSRVETP
jgi:hypothetical protein